MADTILYEFVHRYRPRCTDKDIDIDTDKDVQKLPAQAAKPTGYMAFACIGALQHYLLLHKNGKRTRAPCLKFKSTHVAVGTRNSESRVFQLVLNVSEVVLAELGRACPSMGTRGSARGPQVSAISSGWNNQCIWLTVLMGLCAQILKREGESKGGSTHYLEAHGN